MMWWGLSVLVATTPRLWYRLVVPWAPRPSKEREVEK